MRSVLIAIVLAALSAAAFAQTQQQDYERLRQQGVQRDDAAARAQGFEQQRQQQESERRQEESRRNSESSPSSGGGYSSSPSGGSVVDMRAQGKEMLRLPPLPVERNVLLGSWRLEGSSQQSDAQNSRTAEFAITGRGATPGLGEIMGMLANMESGKMACDMSFGRGITFTPTTFSSGGAAGMAGGPIAYRSRKKNVIVAIPGDSRANPMPFTIAGPNRIVWADTCALVRVGASGASAATNSTASPGDARTRAAISSTPPAAGAQPQVAAVAPLPPPSTPARPPREVCVNTMLDKLGAVGVAQVRAMAKLRFTEAAIEGKVPNSDNLRLDLRGSACDDPRMKAALYDFDASGILQSITYVWERPAGPAPAPIFQERVASLSRFHPSLPQPQTTGRLQGDTSLGRLILQDMPERNLLLEAYKAK